MLSNASTRTHGLCHWGRCLLEKPRSSSRTSGGLERRFEILRACRSIRTFQQLLIRYFVPHLDGLNYSAVNFWLHRRKLLDSQSVNKRIRGISHPAHSRRPMCLQERSFEYITASANIAMTLSGSHRPHRCGPLVRPPRSAVLYP